MKTPRWFSWVIGFALCPGFAVAQRPMKKDDGFLQEKPRLGERVPDLVVYDSQGQEVKVESLRGQYTVLVFGCLT